MNNEKNGIELSQYEKAKKEKTLSTLNNRANSLFPINLSNCKRTSLIIDTETIGDITKGEKAFPYDISFLQVRNGEILHEQSYINQEIFDNKYLMNNAFYKNKIPFYNKALVEDERYIKKHDKAILTELNNFIRENHITYFLAYNVKFDWNSINNLYEVTGMEENLFKKLYLIDIWKVATDILKSSRVFFRSIYEILPR